MFKVYHHLTSCFVRERRLWRYQCQGNVATVVFSGWTERRFSRGYHCDVFEWSSTPITCRLKLRD